LIKIGVIGYGYWGPNLVRNFADAPETEVTAISDLNLEQLARAKRRYPGAVTTPNCNELIESPDVDAVVISTPVSTHFSLALRALENNKHVFVEKPFTSSSSEAMRLIEEADRRGLTLMVDHTFVYSGAVRKMKEVIGSGALGEVYYYDSMRVNLGLIQRDVDVIWDLAVHDLAIMEHVLPARPCAIAATGMSHIPGGKENIAYITAFFDGKLIAHINVNWLSPIKVRRLSIGGSRQMIVYDDLEASEKVKIYDKGIVMKSNPEAVYKMLIGYRSGDMHAPQLDIAEALQTEVRHFAHCIETGERSITGGEAGLQVVRILEAATTSMRNRGRLVELETSDFWAQQVVA
jgi:predicted dehydrogenase